ncbi:hypothetical protein [Mesorhizobium sp.]|uniref:hypothetical protein n=1 Tax=Mesorhizobium sp. TaxID=1871066 RepID=UPI000FEA2604|nr:hypothetical protein [Mesorhizobium sp.]RWM26333.1 MAG: hypothetical protein EOR74_15250 [Mesorhizobium sp.]
MIGDTARYAIPDLSSQGYDYGLCVKTICCACRKTLCSCDDELEAWLASRAEPCQGLVWRARIVLMWADASSLASIVRTLGKTKKDGLSLARLLS